MKVGIDEHRHLINKYGGAVRKFDTHIGVWDILIEPINQIGSHIWRAWHSKLLKAWANRSVQMSITNSSEVNAVAIPSEEADHILLYRGLIEHVLGYTWVLFGTREFLPNIGDSKKEQSIKHTAQFFEQRADLKTGTASVAPICHSRQLVASLAASFALQVALLHEYGHIFGGHFQLLRSGATSVGLDELRVQKKHVPLHVPLSIVEWDADCFASNYSFFVQSKMEVVDGMRPLLSGTVSDPKNHSMLLWILGGHILFRSLSICPSFTYTFEPSLYPPPPLRGFNFFQDMLLRRQYRQGKNRDCDLEIAQVSVMIEQVCARRFNIQQKDDWFFKVKEQSIRMREAYIPQRQKLEGVRRISETWRPLYRL